MEKLNIIENNLYKKAVLSYLTKNYRGIIDFWTDKKDLHGSYSIQDLCDFVYIMHLSNMFEIIDDASISKFVMMIRKFGLPIYKQNPSNKILNIHNTAYLFGTLNLLKLYGYNLYPALKLSDKTIEFKYLINEFTHQPFYPSFLSHHIWRVSHWIGGIPSIIYSLMNVESLPSEELKLTLNQTMIACDHLIDDKTGLFKTYKSESMHQFFNYLYRIRHNPELAEIGGIAHLHWINYLLDRPYKSMGPLFEKSIKIFLSKSPFMEKIPYCLDFDILQIIRTCIGKGAHLPADTENRIIRMFRDIEIFIIEKLNPAYKIHKLPGALAAYHECALLLSKDHLDSFGCATKDIIKEASWL